MQELRGNNFLKYEMNMFYIFEDNVVVNLKREFLVLRQT